MKVYTYSQARQNLSELLNKAHREEVLIRRRDGTTFSVVPKRKTGSPFDIIGISTEISTEDILNAIQESRGRYSYKSEGSHPLRFGEFSGDVASMSTWEDFTIAEWRPTDEELDGS